MKYMAGRGWAAQNKVQDLLKGEVMEAKKAIRERAPETRWLIDRLKKASVGELVTYQDLNKITNSDTQNSGRHYVMSAIRYLLKNENMNFECVINEGYKRTDDAGTLYSTESHVKRIKNHTKKARVKLSLVDPKKLTDDQQRDYIRTYAQTGMLFVVTSRKTENKILKQYNQSNMLEPMKGYIALIKGGTAPDFNIYDADVVDESK